MRHRSIYLSLLVFVLAASLAPASAGAQATSAACGKTHFENARIVALDADCANVSIRDCVQETAGGPAVCGSCPLVNVKVDNLAIRADLKRFRVGDHIRLDTALSKEAGDAPGTMVLKDFRGAWSIAVGRWWRVILLAICALGIFLLAIVATGGHPFAFVVGMDNRYSNSKVQVAFWFWIAISTYVAAWVLRVQYAGWDFAGLVNIPQNLLVLSGMSALTYGGAKAITTSKADDAVSKAKASAEAQTNLDAAKDALAGNSGSLTLHTAVTAAEAVAAAAAKAAQNVKTMGKDADRKFFSNLVQNDVGGYDFGDFQMLVVTLLAVATYVLLFLHFFDTVAFTRTVTLPDVDTTVLSIFGIGQGAYLAKKAGGNVGTA